MALARTNAVAYSAVESEDVFSIGTVAVLLGTGTIKHVETHGDITLVVLDEKLYISTGGVFSRVTGLDFVVNDVTYAESLGQFVAVGQGIATSADGITWTNITGFSTEYTTDFSSSYYIYMAMEIEGSLYVVGYEQISIQGSKYCYMTKVDIINSTCACSEYNSFRASSISFNNGFKGNNRFIIDTSAGAIVGTVEGLNTSSSEYMPMSIIDGYFIAVVGNNVYKSINGVDYSFIGTPAVAPLGVLYLDGYYYILGKSVMCRGTTLADAITKEYEDYVNYDGGIEIPFESSVIMNEKISLLCEGYYIQLTIGGNNDPAVQTIKTLSATQAYTMACEYTDEQIASIVTRLEALENA